MVFDIVSFIAGVAAGGITGALAGVLHGLESTANLQERLRVLTKEVESMRTGFSSGPFGVTDPSVKVKMDELYRNLNEIHEEIRRMYKKATR
jgi:gas vesicle protein